MMPTCHILTTDFGSWTVDQDTDDLVGRSWLPIIPFRRVAVQRGKLPLATEPLRTILLTYFTPFN